MESIQAIEQHCSPQEMAERVRQYHECMEPHIKAVSRIFGLSAHGMTLMQSGVIGPKIYSPQEQQLLDSLGEISRMYMARFGLATPPGDG